MSIAQRLNSILFPNKNDYQAVKWQKKNIRRFGKISSASLIKFKYSLTCQVSHSEAKIHLVPISGNLQLRPYTWTFCDISACLLSHNPKWTTFINVHQYVYLIRLKSNIRYQERPTVEKSTSLGKHNILWSQEYKI